MKNGKHDEEINKQKSWEERREGEKTLISYQNTGSNLAAPFIQTMSASNYPEQATNSALLWLAASTTRPIR